MRRDARHRGDERGQSLLEMAFVVPILLLILAAVVDGARAFDAYIVLTNAAREGARYGSWAPTAVTVAQVQQMVVADVNGSGTNVTHIPDFSAANVTVQGLTATSSAVTVTVSCNLNLWFGGLVGVPTFNLSKSAVMPVFR